jgi:ribosome-associated heat shock protein Hsp15
VKSSPTESAAESGAKQRVRLDKWLWAARFYKTRSQSTEAIGAGHVKVAGERVKSGLAVHVGLKLELVKESVRWEVEVLALSEKRGKGADAALLYRETEEGKVRRARQLE